MSKQTNKVVTPPQLNAPPSSPTFEPHSTATTENASSDGSSAPPGVFPASTGPSSYSPPAVTPTPTPPPSEVVASPSSSKSLPPSPSQKTQSQTSPPKPSAKKAATKVAAKSIQTPDSARTQRPLADFTTKELAELGTVEPDRDPVQGVGGFEYLTYAAHAFSNEKFEEYYADRAEHLIGLHKDTPGSGVAIKRLETLL